MLKKCCYEGLVSLSINKTLQCIQENRGLDMDGVVTAKKGWERGKEKGEGELITISLKSSRLFSPNHFFLG